MWSGTRENRYEVTGPLPPCQRPGPDNDGGVTSRHRRERLSVILLFITISGEKIQTMLGSIRAFYQEKLVFLTKKMCDWSTAIIPLLCSKQREEKACSHIPLPPTSYNPDYITLSVAIACSANSYTLNTRDMDRITSDHTALYISVVTGQ